MDNKQLKISIITVSLNSASTIESTIQSVIGQYYPNLEYIIIDGGSSDGTVDIIKKYQSHISYWVSEPDNGISDAFNKGIKKATGELIGIVSTDDYLPEGSLYIVADAYLKNNYADVIYGKSITYSPDNCLNYIVKPDKDFRSIWKRQPLKHSAMYVTRKAYSKFGLYDTQYRLAMDYELVLRFYLAGANFVYVDESIGAFQTGGVNDRKFVSTVAEVRDISIRYGYSRFPAYLIFYKKVFYLSVKKILLRLNNILPFIRFYRKINPKFIKQ